MRRPPPPLLERRVSLSLLVDGVMVKDVAIRSGKTVSCYPCSYARRYWFLIPLLCEALERSNACYLVVELPRGKRAHLVALALEDGREALFFVASRTPSSVACEYAREVLERLGAPVKLGELREVGDAVRLLADLVRASRARRVAVCSWSGSCVEVRSSEAPGAVASASA